MDAEEFAEKIAAMDALKKQAASAGTFFVYMS